MGVCTAENNKQKNIKIKSKKIRYEDKELNTERGPEGEIEPTKIIKEEAKKEEEKKKPQKKKTSKRKSLIREIREGMIMPLEEEYIRPKQKNKKRQQTEHNKIIEPKVKNEEEKKEIKNEEVEKLEESKNKNEYYFICPNCKTRSPHIKNIYLDQNDNLLKVLYRCACNNSEKEKESPLNLMISKNIPENKCPIHNDNLNLYCKTCKINICNKCFDDKHSDHLIKKKRKCF